MKTKHLFLILCLTAAAVSAFTLDVVIQKGPPDRAGPLAFSPDGKLLAYGNGSQVDIREAASGKIIRTMPGHSSWVSEVLFSPDGNSVLSCAGPQDALKLWETATGKNLWTLTSTEWISGVAISPDGKIFAAGFANKKAMIGDMANGKELKILPAEIGGALAFSPDGKHVAVGIGDTIELWDIALGLKLKTFAWHSDRVSVVGFSPDGKHILSGSEDYNLKLWDIASGKEIRTMRGHAEGIRSAAFSPDGKTIVSNAVWSLKFWDSATGRELKTLTGHNYSQAAITPDGKVAAFSTLDAGIYLWDIAAGRELMSLKRYADAVLSAACGPDAAVIASGYENGVLALWDAVTGTRLWSVAGHGAGVRSVSFSPDGKRILTASNDKTIKLWETASGRELLTIAGHSGEVKFAVFGPDSARILSASSDGTVKLWDAVSGRELRTFTTQRESFSPAVFSPDGKQVAAVTSQGSNFMLRIWDTASGLELLSVKTPQVFSLAFSPDGKRLLAGCNGTVKEWDAKTGEEIKSLVGFESSVDAAAFSPDGKKIAVSDDAGNYIINYITLNAVTGAELLDAGPASASLSFTPDGRRIISACADGVVRISDVETMREIVRLVHFRDSEWACIVYGGYYNASAGAEQYLGVRAGREIEDIDQYRHYKRPDMVKDILGKL